MQCFNTVFTKNSVLICIFLCFMTIDVLAETNQDLREKTLTSANDSGNEDSHIVKYYWLMMLDYKPVEPPPPSYTPLNDTGITWGGDYPSSNNDTCTSNISGPQDCHHGRDATHNDDSDGHAGFSYTKISSTGAALHANATTWSCVKDSVTGLIWEVKTDDGSIHDKDNTYRWGGKTHQGSDYGTYYDDWDTLLDGSNTESLCGYSDWRVPNIMELENLVNRDQVSPSIDTDYFPYTHLSATSFTIYQSATPSARYSEVAWGVSFHDGSSYEDNRDWEHHTVRLVRGEE